MRSKALAGATQGGADGRTSVDQLGTILTWMQERGSESFLFVTANDVTGLPPELLRKGRFDEIFFVDLPNEEEQPKIRQAALAANGRAQHAIGLGAGSARCEQFTGAEIAAIVPEAMFAAFADGGREITTEDLIAATKTVVPLVKTMGDKLVRLREFGETRARPASTKKGRFQCNRGSFGRVISRLQEPAALPVPPPTAPNGPAAGEKAPLAPGPLTKNRASPVFGRRDFGRLGEGPVQLVRVILGAEQAEFALRAYARNQRAALAARLAGRVRFLGVGDGPLRLPLGNQRAVNGRDAPEVDIAPGVG